MRHKAGDQERVPVVIYRGGTSKAVFVKTTDLPSDPAQRDRLLCAIFGSPDKRQIDGLGGADPLTSKLAIVGPSTRDGADVDYTFGQVAIDSPTIVYAAVCGNVSAAVGPFAIDEGFVKAVDSLTKVRIHCTNNSRIIEARVPTENGMVKTEGDYAIDGVPGTGAKIELDWADLVGANTGKLFPTGSTKDVLDVPGVGAIEASIVDVANPGVFVAATSVGLTGRETPDDIDNDAELLRKSEAIVLAAMQKIGTFALLTYVAPPQTYVSGITGQIVDAGATDLLVRMIFMGKTHKAFAASMINCCGVAAMLSGTTANAAAAPGLAAKTRVRMGHPSGIAELEGIEIDRSSTPPLVKRISVYRTARRLMEGNALVRRSLA